MSVFKETIQYIKDNENRKFIGIPFELGGKFEHHLPYIEKKRLHLVFGASGIGKTKFSLNRYVIRPYLYSKQTNYPLKIIYLSLEVPKEDVMGGIISYLYAKEYGVKESKEFFLRDKPGIRVINNIEKLEEKYGDLSEKIDIISNFDTVNDIVKYVRQHFNNNGKLSKDDNNKTVYQSNSDLHTIILTDTLNSILPNEGQTQYTAIRNYSYQFCKREFVEIFGATVVNVQQQDKNSENSQFNNKGIKVDMKTLPDRTALAECKQTFNDADVVISLYSPTMYGIERYPFTGGNFWDMSIWGDNYRRVCVEKNRHGMAQFEVDTFFDGRINHFAPLPHPQSSMNDKNVLNKYIQ